MADMSVLDCRRLFTYEPDTGVLRWKTRGEEEFKNVPASKVWNTRFAGKPAGCAGPRSSDRYLIIFFQKKTYRVHRIIWTIVHGNQPAFIDHINGNIRDNRIGNLRSVTNAENCRNQKVRVTNVTGVTGVRWLNGGWIAEITVNGTRNYLGKFQDMESAASARKSAEVALGFHPNHGRAA